MLGALAGDIGHHFGHHCGQQVSNANRNKLITKGKVSARLPTPPVVWVHQIHTARGLSGYATMVMVFARLFVFLCGLVTHDSSVRVFIMVLLLPHISLHHTRNKCVGQKHLCPHCRKQCRHGCALWQPMLLITGALTKNFCQAKHERLHWQQLPSLSGGAQAPQDKCLVGEGVELLTTISLNGYWTMATVKLCAPCTWQTNSAEAFQGKVCATAYSAQAATQQ